MLPKNYDPNEIEPKWQKFWLDEKIYKYELDEKKPSYAIDTPPPFTSGTLHLGHVLSHTWIDIIARYKRMTGYNVLFPQGFDNHGLPTELKVEKEFGISKDQPEKFLQKCIEWTWQAIEAMRNQFIRIGYSADWDLEYHTMDDWYKAAVQKSLIEFYKKGMLYQAEHPVYWCPRCRTSLAKAEVGYVEEDGFLYYIKLPLADGSGHVPIATTRPELMPACVAVFVHPEDERYKHVVGKKVKLPIFEREVPVLADEDVDPSFGTGAVYNCTYGDEQDVVWQKRYNLPVIIAINEDGTMNENAGPYAGLKTEEARKKIAEDLEKMGLLYKKEKIRHRVLRHTERSSCMAPIELLPKKQWFIKVKDFTDEIVKVAEQINWYPPDMFLRLKDWAESMDWDWVISRQRVFGTPIPFWVCDNGEIILPNEEDLPVDPRFEKPPRKCSDGSEPKPVTDVLDCWVDSSITPLIITKWHEAIKGDEEGKKWFEHNFPTALRPQGTDIIRTWAFYTIFRTWVLTGEKPWHDILINGMVAGPDGRKMSKSYGNVVAPDEVIPKYGADALRLWTALAPPGEDHPFKWETVDYNYRFLQKVWNIYRFAERHLENFDPASAPEELEPLDRWILSRLHRLIKFATEEMEKYRFNLLTRELITFVWHEVADDYIEMIKYRLYGDDEESKLKAKAALYELLYNVMLLLAPFVPHITEELYQNLFRERIGAKSVHLLEWPKYSEARIDEEAEKLGELAREIVGAMRRYKNSHGLSLNAKLKHVAIYTTDSYEVLKTIEKDIAGTMNIEKLEIIKGEPELEERIIEIKPNFKTVGPRYGKLVPKITAYLKENAEEVAKALKESGKIEFEVDGQKVELTKDDIVLRKAVFSEGEEVETAVVGDAVILFF
ncbi:valyl-tRNA synthetase [Thermococcus kodakarensis KOD1]|uniref:Valine--tRNA ligase n=1 Tax=Thermococcus kodakarensis (strain ATCC BAA-918 / JCM 12380 / KOD1) TaxID=69014 RepID=SYV_THEKO|nr:valine--tRNA ligase [Thermococcus kodakarensis]Q5JGN7.1 RecName: Full=Valine--tRNA ligase; AltName: Full=Valyl-tRNA synthetase; Short=ValRS [Thermococcus kodakarensis KOD1]WCN29315.1 valine--tRNA ligase [Thermococcus kodakarensis]WCN31611.1 valine--tRNA ligase [Thermococcus kodakarensis]BAD85463.1 valyl-tRNA synthetase [Thermococcus kodakarensis KOD1]